MIQYRSHDPYNVTMHKIQSSFMQLASTQSDNVPSINTFV